MFREKHPVAWMFHRNTIRWPFNWLVPPDEPDSTPVFKEYLGASVLSLPESPLPETSLRLAITNRFSCRRFTGAPLTLHQLATVVKMAYGIQGRASSVDLEMLERPVPSGGGLYPLEIYLLVQNVEGVEPGLYHYAALHHTLEQIQAVCLAKAVVNNIFMEQPYVIEAAVLVVLVLQDAAIRWDCC